MLYPRSSSMIRGRPSRMTATQLFVVPRSMPTVRPIRLHSPQWHRRSLRCQGKFTGLAPDSKEGQLRSSLHVFVVDWVKTRKTGIAMGDVGEPDRFMHPLDTEEANRVGPHKSADLGNARFRRNECIWICRCPAVGTAVYGGRGGNPQVDFFGTGAAQHSYEFLAG